MHRRRTPVLADRENVGALRSDVAHGLAAFVAGFAEADHDPALARQVGCALLRAPQHLERPRVPRLRPDALVEPLDRLDVVIQDLRALRKHRVERLRIAGEIRDQHLDGRARRLPADLTDRRGEQRRASVGELVYVEGRHDRMTEFHLRDRGSDSCWLNEIDYPGASRLYRAEPARARAGVPQDHERGGPRAPALGHVRAMRFLADGVERLRAHELAQVLVLGPHWQPDLQPAGTRAVDRHDRIRFSAPARAGTLDLARDLETDRCEFSH